MQNSVPSNWPNSQYSEYVETRFHSWHIQRLGKSRGKKILFIHGTGSSCHTWSDIIECLQDEFDVLLVDLPGHGFSRIPAPSQSSLQSVFNGLTELIEKIRFVPDLIVGHSAGAAIAVLLSEKIKAKSGVICINAAFGEFPGLAGVMFPIFAKIIAVVPFSSDVLAGLSKNKERTEKLIANTGSKLIILTKSINPLNTDCNELWFGAGILENPCPGKSTNKTSNSSSKYLTVLDHV